MCDAMYAQILEIHRLDACRRASAAWGEAKLNSLVAKCARRVSSEPMRSDAATLDDAVCRVYKITYTGDQCAHTAAGRFKIQSGSVWLLDDPAKILAR